MNTHASQEGALNLAQSGSGSTPRLWSSTKYPCNTNKEQITHCTEYVSSHLRILWTPTGNEVYIMLRPKYH